jgi:hypothetical protein
MCRAQQRLGMTVTQIGSQPYNIHVGVIVLS